MPDKDKDLLKLCQLWYVTRQATFGMQTEEQHAEALTAYDSLVQEVIARHYETKLP